MSELLPSIDRDGYVPPSNESLVDMERRHKAETRKLEGEIRALLKTAKKNTKAQIETQILRMQYDMKGRHAEELEECESRQGAIHDLAVSLRSGDNRLKILFQQAGMSLLHLKKSLCKPTKMFYTRLRKLMRR